MDELRVGGVLAQLTQKLRDGGVKSRSLFGSAVKGQVTEKSDLDFLVEFDGPATFDRYMGLQELLESQFRVKVDLVTYKALMPLIRDQIFGEAIKVA